MVLVRSAMEIGCRLGMRVLEHMGWIRLAIETILGMRNIIGAYDGARNGFGV